MWTVWVLLWKHTIVRYRRKYKATFFEYITPLIFLGLIYLVATTADHNTPKKHHVQRTEPLMYDDLLRQHEGGRILFTPENQFTNRLMNEVGAKLNISRLDHLPSSEETGFCPFTNDTSISIMNYSKGMTSEDAIVIFEDMESDTWPKKLNYTIRMKNNFMSDEDDIIDTGLFWPFDLDQHEDYGTQYDAFMRLQWALDTSFLRLLTGANVDQTLTFQEFPSHAGAMDHMRRNFIVCVSSSFLVPLGIMVTYSSLAMALYEGKNSGMHELVKMAGVSWEVLAVSYVLDLVPIMLVYVVSAALFYELTGFVTQTGFGYMAVALALHFFSLVALAFAIVYIFNLTQHIPIVLAVIYLASLIVGLFTVHHVSMLLSVLIPHAPFIHFWITLGVRELRAEPTVTLTIPEAYLFMTIQTLFLFMVAWYFSKVRPGAYGQALPWNFLFIKDYWCMQPKASPAPTEAQLVNVDDQQYFEKAPAGLPVGIQITDVYKSFGKDTVLHGVNLTVYRDEITVLLGHNGAGKTTLINIITGLISATSGTVLVEGKDTVKQAKEIRKIIGLCPQQNIFFQELTVLQHVRFFAMVKGKSCSQARALAVEILTKLNLSNKGNALPQELSGGMKRRVQLACAMAGGARVLVLDEPTSGLDVETRRELWDLLLSLRGNRTVLLTTHFMEEADALGDRIAALHHGRVRCNATAMFLKRAIGTGYRVSFTTIGAPKEADITSAITAAVPDATVRDRQPNGITYNLPAKDTAHFPALFAALEDRRSELRIDTIGVGKSTLDEVFVKLCSDEKLAHMEELDAVVPEPPREKVTGNLLYVRQFHALLWRQWCYVTSSIYSLILITAVMLVLFWLITESSNNNPFGTPQHEKAHTAVALDLDLYEARPERRVLVKADRDTLEALRMGFSDVEFKATIDVHDAVLRAITEEDQEYLVGIELNDTSAKALYTTTVRHAAPVALNALSNALAARMLASNAEPSMRAEPRTFTARYQPLRGAYVPYHEREIRHPKKEQNIQTWASNVAMITLFYLITMMWLPCLERAAGTRHALVMAGAPRALVWAATLLAHLAQASLICVLPLVAFSALVDRDDTFNQTNFLFTLCMLMMLGLQAFLGLVYLVTTLTRPAVVSTALLVCVIIFTAVTPKVPESSKLMSVLASVAYALMPPHALTVGLLRAGKVAHLNAHCHLNRHKCPMLDGPKGFEAHKCCGSHRDSEPFSYLATGGGAGWALTILAGQAVVYSTLTLLVDSGALGRLRARLRPGAPPPPRFADPAARAEAEYVAKAIQLSKKKIPDAILCHNLQKSFSNCCQKTPFFAVKGLTFSVKKGECFGLLGVNGAGKSTTFSMLTGQLSPTGGDIYANGHRVGDGVAYMRTFSYCPQFGGADDFLTGRQNLALLLTMRGLQATSVTAVTAYWIEEVDLSRAADRRVSSYSGGMARRLAAAAALCQAAQTAVLDEPTAGVDPVARRHMHVALMRARRNRSLIVASHSMDEMEALCHRIAIMSGGEVRALGSAAALKAQYGKGYSVVFKLASTGDADGAAMLEEFKKHFSRRFECELRDEHRGTLSYHVKESLRYSELFSQLEQLREQFPALVEDYTVTETTLEEVFLILAKEAHEAHAAPAAPPV